VAHGGKLEDTLGRKCLCNALLANIGHAQVRPNGALEPALVTVGDDLNKVARFLAPGRTTYTAADVVEHLLNPSALPPELVASDATFALGF
jgi:nitronate monooxygenase